MQNEKYTDFDLELRSMLQDAEEEVPSRVWSALSNELDRRDHRKVVALRWRRAGVAVAAAAAVCGAVFIGINGFRGSGIAPEAAPMVAQAEQQETVPDIEEQIAASADILVADVPQVTAAARPAVAVPSEISTAAVIDVPAEEEAVSEEETVTAPTGTESAVREPAVPSTKKNPAAEENIWDDPFSTMEEEKESTNRTSFFISGNATSNDISNVTPKPMRSPGVGSLTTGVQERSVSTYGIPLSLGMGVRFSVSDRLSLGTGLDWTLLSRSFTGIYSDGAKSVNSEINNDIHYIGIPLNLYFDILSDKKLKFYAWGGGSVEKGLVNRFRIHNGSDDIIFKQSVKGLQWSSAIGLGIEFSLNDHLGLYLDPSARYYFDCGQPNSVRTAKPFMLNFEAGLRFDL